MARTLARQLLDDHLVDGDPSPGAEIAIRIDQTLTQDATGTLVMLELAAMGLERVQTELSAQYVDHNLIQQDHRNPDDHLFLESACRRFGVWFSRPGHGVSHPLHMQHFGVPGKSLLGSDSHTCAAGALGMLAMGAGGLDVAMAMAGEPFHLKMPEIWGIELTGEHPPYVSAKDVILEILRRHGVSSGVGRILEYHGPGVASLSVWDRHTIANMGQETGATTSVWPSDDVTRAFLRRRGRGGDWRGLSAERGATYDVQERIDLSTLEPLIARPSSPGDVVAVREVAGKPIYQAYIGSSANPGYRDLAVAAELVDGRRVPPQVSFDLNPAARSILVDLMRSGALAKLVAAGGRLHQVGCNGCIGMGQAPASGRISLRTVPRNFPGRSGTREDAVYLCSPETAAVSALHGEITDPRDHEGTAPVVDLPATPVVDHDLLVPPLPAEEAAHVELVRGPNVQPLPEFDAFPERVEAEVLLLMGDDVSTDEIMPAGAEVLPYRSNVPRIADFCFSVVDGTYPDRARDLGGDHALVAGRNYGQGSSREHAAVAPRHLGLRLVLAEGYSRIHRDNLVNFGMLPLRFADPDDRSALKVGDVIVLDDAHDVLVEGEEVTVTVGDRSIRCTHDLTARELEVLRAGGRIPWMASRA